MKWLSPILLSALLILLNLFQEASALESATSTKIQASTKYHYSDLPPLGEDQIRIYSASAYQRFLEIKLTTTRGSRTHWFECSKAIVFPSITGKGKSLVREIRDIYEYLSTAERAAPANLVTSFTYSKFSELKNLLAQLAEENFNLDRYADIPFHYPDAFLAEIKGFIPNSQDGIQTEFIDAPNLATGAEAFYRHHYDNLHFIGPLDFHVYWNGKRTPPKARWKDKLLSTEELNRSIEILKEPEWYQASLKLNEIRIDLRGGVGDHGGVDATRDLPLSDEEWEKILQYQIYGLEYLKDPRDAHRPEDLHVDQWHSKLFSQMYAFTLISKQLEELAALPHEPQVVKDRMNELIKILNADISRESANKTSNSFQYIGKIIQNRDNAIEKLREIYLDWVGKPYQLNAELLGIDSSLKMSAEEDPITALQAFQKNILYRPTVHSKDAKDNFDPSRESMRGIYQKIFWSLMGGALGLVIRNKTGQDYLPLLDPSAGLFIGAIAGTLTGQAAETLLNISGAFKTRRISCALGLATIAAAVSTTLP